MAWKRAFRSLLWHTMVFSALTIWGIRTLRRQKTRQHFSWAKPDLVELLDPSCSCTRSTHLQHTFMVWGALLVPLGSSCTNFELHSNDKMIQSDTLPIAARWPSQGRFQLLHSRWCDSPGYAGIEWTRKGMGDDECENCEWWGSGKSARSLQDPKIKGKLQPYHHHHHHPHHPYPYPLHLPTSGKHIPTGQNVFTCPCGKRDASHAPCATAETWGQW